MFFIISGDVLRFQQNLEQQYGLMHPPIFEGTYSQALEKAKKEDEIKRDENGLFICPHCDTRNG